MSFKPFLSAVLLVGLLALGLGSAAAQAPTPQLPVNPEGVALVAKVNDIEITLPDYLRALARRQVEVLAADPATLEADVLEQLIDQALLEQGATAQEIVVTDDEVQAELQINLELAGSEAVWNEWLTINNFTPEEFLETLRATLLTNKVRDWLTADLSGDLPQVHARHILVQTEADALNVAARLKAGEDFGVIAQQVSLDETTRGLGGDLGWFAHDELLAPELETLAFSLQPGQIGGPVSSVLGYHLVQTLESGARPVDPQRRVYISQNRFENWLDQLRQTAIIERYI
ncbi:MAG TPA: peptidylprolyl isomerase [Phototrophicaceae bacterium]|nr:peptidylprolyl isomerase [Phototrophicaceae bacterium]